LVYEALKKPEGMPIGFWKQLPDKKRRVGRFISKDDKDIKEHGNKDKGNMAVKIIRKPEKKDIRLSERRPSKARQKLMKNRRRKKEEAGMMHQQTRKLKARQEIIISIIANRNGRRNVFIIKKFHNYYEKYNIQMVFKDTRTLNIEKINLSY
jgi:hypothetical protein